MSENENKTEETVEKLTSKSEEINGVDTAMFGNNRGLFQVVEFSENSTKEKPDFDVVSGEEKTLPEKLSSIVNPESATVSENLNASEKSQVLESNLTVDAVDELVKTRSRVIEAKPDSSLLIDAKPVAESNIDFDKDSIKTKINLVDAMQDATLGEPMPEISETKEAVAESPENPEKTINEEKSVEPAAVKHPEIPKPVPTKKVQTAYKVPDPEPEKKSGISVGGAIIISLITSLLLSACAGYLGYFFAMRDMKNKAVVIGPQTSVTEPAVSESAIPEAIVDVNNDSESKIDVSDMLENCVKSVVEVDVTSTTYDFFGYGYQAQGAGSGVIINEDGYIVTNAHVVEGTTDVSVTTSTGNTYTAEVVGVDKLTDIAVIKITADEKLVAATIGSSENARVGDTTYVIGNPLGTLNGSVSKGIISALNREVVIENQKMTLLQTDATINSGNSGGGLFNDEGELIGIVNAKDSGFTSSGAVIEGLGFAIPIDKAIDIASQLISSGEVVNRPVLGITVSEIQSSPYIPAGLYVIEVLEDGVAKEAGMERFDRIKEFDGKEITSYADLAAELDAHKPGDEIEVIVERFANPKIFEYGSQITKEDLETKDITLKVTLKGTTLKA